ncbi:MAG TPA: Gfo/Idh/MocA family oxidoreductase [Chthoniobacteraceae bacterium]|nr:Gfo/Idh/MocA family oxidoreductase [Chthoniobacteraceae bacterium]
MFRDTTLPVPVAIVGLGRAGWNMHLKALVKHGGFQIVDVADPVAERCREAADLTGCGAFSDIDALLAKTKAELVVVATPSSMHYEDAAKVFRSGRHCILEKPMAFRASEAVRLAEMAGENNLGLFVHHNQLHLPEYWHLKQAMAGDVLGKLFHLRVFWGMYRRRWDWQTLKKNGGGQLSNTCSHVLSIVLPLLPGRAECVYCELRNIKDAGDAEDHVHLVLQTDTGMTVDVVVSTAIEAMAPRWMLCGEYGTLVSDGTRGCLRYIDPAGLPPLSVIDAAAPNRAYMKEELCWREEEIRADASSIPPFHQNVFEALTRQAPLVVTPESAIEVVRVIEEARLAATLHSTALPEVPSVA